VGIIQVTSQPAGAVIQLDGRAHGRTPAAITAETGHHQVRLELQGYADPPIAVDVQLDETATVDQRLWLRTPVVERLRPLLPGASIADVRFLRDGTLAVLQQLPGDGWQLWLRQAQGTTHRVGPSSSPGRLAMSEDGQLVAYLANQKSDTLSGGHLDQLWVLQPDGQGRRLVYQLPASSGEQDLVDLSWSPDGRHLIAFARQRPVAGGSSTRVFVVDSAGQAVNELVTMPSDVVAGSSTWDAEGQRVGFLTRSGEATSLFVIGLAQLDARYLADVSRSDSQVAPFAPLAWAPQGAGFVYSAPDQLQSSSSWLGSQPSPALFSADEIFGKPQRLGASEGETPAWLDQQTLVGLARKPHEGPLVVREVKRSGASSDVADLPFKANAYAARWDVQRGQAVVAVAGGAGGFSTSSDYWLVQLQGTAR
jgi:hypothetical protein